MRCLPPFRRTFMPLLQHKAQSESTVRSRWLFAKLKREPVLSLFVYQPKDLWERNLHQHRLGMPKSECRFYGNAIINLRCSCVLYCTDSAFAFVCTAE